MKRIYAAVIGAVVIAACIGVGWSAMEQRNQVSETGPLYAYVDLEHVVMSHPRYSEYHRLELEYNAMVAQYQFEQWNYSHKAAAEGIASQQFAAVDAAGTAALNQELQAKVLLKEYRKLVPTISQPAYLLTIDQTFGGDVDAFVDHLFAKSIYGSVENFEQFASKPTAKALADDPMIAFARSVKEEREHLNDALKSFDDGYNLAHRTYVEGLLRMHEGGQPQWPDANFTLRLTYGQIKGYSPRDCDYYGYQTTLEGVMEKEDSTNWEFVVPAKLKELYKHRDFGPYATKQGTMPVALCATTHTTGGNSGSPVLNARGELIGLNFDRNWEGVGGDIEYLPDYQRSIIVDIRYVLFLIDKYAGADYLLDELEIVK